MKKTLTNSQKTQKKSWKFTRTKKNFFCNFPKKFFYKFPFPKTDGKYARFLASDDDAKSWTNAVFVDSEVKIFEEIPDFFSRAKTNKYYVFDHGTVFAHSYHARQNKIFDKSLCSKFWNFHENFVINNMLSTMVQFLSTYRTKNFIW